MDVSREINSLTVTLPFLQLSIMGEMAKKRQSIRSIESPLISALSISEARPKIPVRHAIYLPTRED